VRSAIIKSPDKRRYYLLVFFVLCAVLVGPSIRSSSFNVWIGALATGLCLSFVALGVFLSFRILNFPDLTVEGSFPLGAAVSAVLIIKGINPFLTLLLSTIGGAMCGIVTALIAVKLKIHSLLASIITITALYSINLMVMGSSNIPLFNNETIFTPFVEPFHTLLRSLGAGKLLRLSSNLLTVVLVGIFVIFVHLLLKWFMKTEFGLALQCTGDNPRMLRSLGTDTNRMLVFGLALSNGLIGLSGALFTQYQGFADINLGQGLIIAGIAAVIIGETLFLPDDTGKAMIAVMVGIILYRFLIAGVLNIKFDLPSGKTFRIDSRNVKLVTAGLVFFALWISRGRETK
jgi:putative ABC transport system permease protein